MRSDNPAIKIMKIGPIIDCCSFIPKEKNKMGENRIIKNLDEISAYFYKCYLNAGRGTKAQKQFHNWMCAVDRAKNIVEQNTCEDVHEGLDFI